MSKITFDTMYQFKKRTKKKMDTTIMTVPRQALTNKEHLKNIKMGLSPQAVKMIFDPNNTFPDLRAMDIVDQQLMLKNVRSQVNEIRTRGEARAKEIMTQKKEDENSKFKKFQTELDKLKKTKEEK